MGSLASALGPIASRLCDAPRVYVDANVPVGLVAFMRQHLGWDVFFVLEDAGLRRASDRTHFERALDGRRTLVTLDTDFLDDRRFPPVSGPGVIVLTAPDERGLRRLVTRADRDLLRTPTPDGPPGVPGLPLKGRTVHLVPEPD
jgi:hypothetical protein